MAMEQVFIVEEQQLKLTDEQKKHKELMLNILQEVQDRPMVLKGGTALMLAHGLDRFSEDIDLDANKGFSLEAAIKKGCARAGVNLNSLEIAKDTGTTKRYYVDYDSEFGARRLKIESSMREHIDFSEVEKIHGVQVYSVSALIEQKIRATQGRDKIRDLYDLNFLLRHHSDKFTAHHLNDLKELGDPLHITEKYKANYGKDKLLSHLSLDDLALGMSSAIEQLQRRHQKATELPMATLKKSPSKKNGFSR